MRDAVVFITDGIEVLPVRELVRWFRLGGSEPVFTGVPGVTRVFVQGSGSGIEVRSVDSLDPAEVRGLVMPESPTLAHELMRPRVAAAIHRLLAADVPVVTWGGGIVACLRAGLLTAGHVAGPYESIPDLVGAGVEVADQPVVVEGLWITARSAMDLPQALRAAFGFGAHPVETVVSAEHQH